MMIIDEDKILEKFKHFKNVSKRIMWNGIWM
jgi:hypothetical protein